MASIIERTTPLGFKRWLVCFRRKGFKKFHITFDDREAAISWAEENEEKYFSDPDEFFKMKQKIIWEMLRKKVYTLDHIVRIGKKLTRFS